MLHHRLTTGARHFFNCWRRASDANPRRRRRGANWLGAEVLEARQMLQGDPIVTFNTNFGSFEVELYQNVAPQTVANFLHYVESGSYNDSIFHRLVPGFVLQGGGFTSTSDTFSSTSQISTIPTNSPVPSEASLSNVQGTLAMALSGTDANSATDEFFFNLADNSKILDKGNSVGNPPFTVFGAVINGMNVVDAMAAASVHDESGGDQTSPFSQLPLGSNNQLLQITSIVVDGSIQGTVFNDSNANGVRDNGEAGRAGATVFLDVHGDGQFHSDDPSAVTDANGNYTFSNVAPGSYTVRERLDLQQGITVTTPEGDAASVTVVAGQTATGPDFGNVVVTTVAPVDVVTQPFGGTTDDESFVTGLYHNILSRPPETTGLHYWMDQLAGPRTRTQVVQWIWSSPEHRTDEIDGYYQTFFGRSADPAGLSAWLAEFAHGATETQVVTDFILSPEFQNDVSATGGQSANLVTKLFDGLLARAPDSAALNYFSQQLDQNSSGLANITAAILGSHEFDNLVIDGYYTALLHRAVDDNGAQSWNDALSSGRVTPAEVAESLMASDEYWNDAGAKVAGSSTS